MGILDYFLGTSAEKVSPEEAYRKHAAEAGDALIVDVRQPAEWASGTIPGAARVPLTHLGGYLDELPKERQLLTICASNHRSPLAARRLKKAGFDVLDVAGGMQAWREAGLPVEESET